MTLVTDSPNISNKSPVRHDVPIIFKPDDRFQSSNPDQNHEDPWQSLLPRKLSRPLFQTSKRLTLTFVAGRGFIEIPNYQISKDDESATASSYYAISMFHQLHCLVRSPIPPLHPKPTPNLKLTLPPPHRQVSKTPSSP
jgi:hypothetical protein